MSEINERVEKPWGYELHWAKTDRYVGKLIHVNAGHALSLQYHNQKDETIFLWTGRMLFEITGRGRELVKREMRARARRSTSPRHRPSHDGHHRLRHLRSVDAGTPRRRAARRSVRRRSSQTLSSVGFAARVRPEAFCEPHDCRDRSRAVAAGELMPDRLLCRHRGSRYRKDTIAWAV